MGARVRAALPMAMIPLIFAFFISLTPATAGGAEPVRLGYMGPLTGILASTGKEMLEGFQFFYEQVGYRCGSRTVELVVEDSEGNPSVALAKLRKLIDRDRVKALAGIQFSNIGYAVAPVIDREKLPLLLLTTSDDITKRQPAKFVTRVSSAASQVTHPLADYAYKTLGYRRAATIAMDLAWGHEAVAGFQKVFEDAGGKVVRKIWTPTAALDFAAYLTQIPRDVDVVFSTYAAMPAVRFMKQYAEYGLKGRIPLISIGYQLDEAVLRLMGDEAVGIISGLFWSPTLDNPTSQAFVKSFIAKYSKTPSVYHLSLWDAARWICEGLKATEGKNEDPETFVAAIRRAARTLDNPRGPVAIDDYGNPTQNVYILKAEKVGGKLQNTVIHTYPLVSQFWTYRPAEFLKHPAYSRDYPPVRP